MTVVVTGGAGYIGAHVVRALEQAGEEVVVIDDLSTGRADRVGGAKLVEAELGAPDTTDRLVALFRVVQPQAVIHFAARKQVGESVQRPTWYTEQNVGGMAQLLTAMEATGVDRLVFSSSAAVYGQPDVERVTEDTPQQPINPYGRTKLYGEWLARDAARAWGLRFAGLRYFNVAGAGAPELGDPAVLNLVPMVLDRLAKGERPAVFGDDYPTPDGTCVRDYVHVGDLADAHVTALDYLTGDDRPFDVFNVGTGVGSSVREVVDTIGQVTGLDTTPQVGPRRPGDPAVLVGSNDRITEVLGWQARYGLTEIVSSAWEAWQAGPRRIALG